MRNVLRVNDLSAEQQEKIIEDAQKMKGRMAQRERPDYVFPENFDLTFLTTKDSARTRESQRQAARWLGANFSQMGPSGVAGKEWNGFREPPAHLATVLANMGQGTDLLVVRCNEHQALDQMAEAIQDTRTRIVNGLSVEDHLLQALADAATVREKLGAEWKRYAQAFVGPWNNVSKSLALLLAQQGVNFRLACPHEVFEDGGSVWEEARRIARQQGSQMEHFIEPEDAVINAAAVHTDVGVSMGQEDETAKLLKIYAPYRVTRDLMELTLHPELGRGKGGFLHCMPTHKEEVEPEVANGPNSWIFAQASHRAATLPPLYEEMGLLVPKEG